MSFSARTNSDADSALKHTPPATGCRPSSADNVTPAVASANSLSFSGALSFLRPKSTSARPKPGSGLDGLAHLAGDLRQRGQPLLERRVRGEELGGGGAPVGRHDEERVHAG